MIVVPSIVLASPTAVGALKRLSQKEMQTWMFVAGSYMRKLTRPYTYRNPLDDMRCTFGVPKGLFGERVPLSRWFEDEK